VGDAEPEHDERSLRPHGRVFGGGFLRRPVASLTPRCSKCQSVFTARESIHFDRGSQDIISGIRHDVCPEEPTLTGATRCRFHDVDLAPGLACGKCAEDTYGEMKRLAEHIEKSIPGHLSSRPGEAFVGTFCDLIDTLLAKVPPPFSEERLATASLGRLAAYMAKNFPEQGPAEDPVRCRSGGARNAAPRGTRHLEVDGAHRRRRGAHWRARGRDWRPRARQ